MDNGEALNPDGVIYFVDTFFKKLDKELRSRSDRVRYEARRFCVSERCQLLVESMGWDYMAFLEYRGLREQGREALARRYREARARHIKLRERAT